MIPTSRAWREATAPLWRDNLAFAQLLGLCPLLAVTTTLVNGLALGIATAAVVLVGSTTMSLLRPILVPSARFLVAMLLFTALVTAIDLISAALLYDLHQNLGLFIPLIVVNSGLLAHTENVANRRGVAFTIVSSLATGLGFMFALLSLGALRELLGSGTLFAGIELLGGDGSRSLTVELPFGGMLVALAPPGAFFGIALLLALRNRLIGAPPRDDATGRRGAPR
jgi:electron transport complex protein RnfE